MCLWHFIFYTSSGYSMNLLIGNKFNTIIINETNNFTMQIILQIKIQNLRPFIKSFIKRRKNSDKNHSISPPKKFHVSTQREETKFWKKRKKQNTIRIEISFPEKPRTVFFSFFSSRNVVRPSGIRQERYCATVNRLADARLASCSSTVKGSV